MEKMSRFTKQLLACAVVAVGFMVSAPAVHAVAMYDASAMGLLTITAVTGDVIVSLDVGPGVDGVLSSIITSGGGVAGGSGDVTPPPPPVPILSGVAGTISQMVAASGSATVPGDMAFSDFMTTGVITVEGLPGAAGGAVEVMLDYSLFALASSGGLGEFAFGTSAVGVSDLAMGSLFMHIIADDTGAGAAGGGMIPFIISVGPGEVDGLIIGIDAMGEAGIDIVVDGVPEPVSAVLGLMGLAALGAATRRWVT